MKVLQIVNYQYPHIGGIEQVAKDMSDAMKLIDSDDASGRQIEQKIICFNEDATDGQITCHRGETVHEDRDGIEIIRCGCFAKVASQSLSLTYRGELKKLFKTYAPDVVIFHYPNPFVASFLMPMLPEKVKFVVVWHLDITKQKILGKLFNGQSRRILKRADQVVATSPNYIEGSPFLSLHKDKCRVIPNCIRPERLEVDDYTLDRIEEIKETYKDKFIVFSVGRHVPYKGMGYLVEAAKYLSDDYVVLIGGKGPLTDELKAKAKELGLTNTEFLGRVEDQDMAAYYSACQVYAFPSITKNEAFGIALAEGMYFGKPAVTFTIPGSGVNFVNLAEVTGIECPNGDAESFAKAIIKLHDDSLLRDQYGANARKRVTENFMFDQYKIHVGKLLEDLAV